MRTKYKIDTFQETYFVIETSSSSSIATRPDFAPYYEAMKGRSLRASSAVLATDKVYNRGTLRTSSSA
jgi:phenylalanine-4-hydroxylase